MPEDEACMLNVRIGNHDVDELHDVLLGEPLTVTTGVAVEVGLRGTDGEEGGVGVFVENVEKEGHATNDDVVFEGGVERGEVRDGQLAVARA